MRGELVDERDSSWESHDPRFRILVFEGARNAVRAVDIVDASVDDAFESARALSEGDRRLWSLALVTDDRQGGRGLVWLSGMDYNDAPVTAKQWALRRQMQNRYLMAKVQRRQPPLLPNGLRVIRVFPEWVSGLPLWESFTDQYHLDPGSLDLSHELSAALFAWNEEWLSRSEDEPLADPRGWRRRGLRLVGQLQAELDGVAEIRPEFL
jgi:hypothetical protein